MTTELAPLNAPGIRLENVKVGERARRDYGDLEPLKASLLEHGLLQPIVLLPDNSLLCGGRRLEAVRQLGWESIGYVVSHTQNDALSRLRAERDENTCRKDMTPSELVAIGRKLEEMKRPETLEKQVGGLRRGTEIPVSADGPKREPRDTREEVADALGMSSSQYSRAKRVIIAAEDESLPDEVRIAALEAQDQMDKGEISVTRADTIVKEAIETGTNPAGNVKLPEAKRLEQIAALADTGRTSGQIGDEIGLGEDQVRRIAAKNGITITADEVLRGRRRTRIDHNHVVNHLVTTLEALMSGLEMVDLNELDEAHMQYWADSLTQTTRGLNRFAKKIKEKTQQ